jgi:hypothetical protein
MNPSATSRAARFFHSVERGQTRPKVRVFAEQRLLFPLTRGRPSHLPHEMHDRVAMRDIDIELVECVAAKRFEIFLSFYLDIMPCQIGTQLVAIGTEFIGNRRKKDADRHARVAQNSRPAFHISGVRQSTGYRALRAHHPRSYAGRGPRGSCGRDGGAEIFVPGAMVSAVLSVIGLMRCFSGVKSK